MPDGNLQPGFKINDRYEVIKPLGTGGMTMTYLVKDHQIGRLLSLKFIAEWIIDSAAMLKQFRTSGRQALELKHRNIVQIYNMDVFDDTCFLTMDYVSAGSLHSLLRKVKNQGRKVGIEATLGIAVQICDALIYAHKFVTHYTINTRNVMLTPVRQGDQNTVGGMVVRLADFEIKPLLLVGDMDFADTTDDRSHYLAPELRSNSKGDVRADIFSAGVVMYETLTGQPPNFDTYVSPEMIRDEIPNELARVVNRCLKFSPGDRPRNAQEFRTDLGGAWEQVLGEFDFKGDERKGFKRRRRGRRPVSLEDGPGDSGDQEAMGRTPSVLEKKTAWSECDPALTKQWWGHQGPVYAVTTVPNSCHVISGSHDTSCRVWDVETGKTVMKLTESHRDWVRSVAVSGDGRFLVSGSQDKSIVMWDLEDGSPIREFKGHGDHVLSLTILPDHKLLSASADKTIRIWDLGSAKQERVIQAHKYWVWSVAASGRGDVAISGSADGTAKIWDLKKGSMIHELDDHEDSVVCVAITRDGRRAVTGSADKSLKIWDVGSGRLVRTLRGHKDVIRSVALSPSGDRIISASSDRTVRVWGSDGTPKRAIGGYEKGVYAVTASPCGQYLIVGCLDSSVSMYLIDKPGPGDE